MDHIINFLATRRALGAGLVAGGAVVCTFSGVMFGILVPVVRLVAGPLRFLLFIRHVMHCKQRKETLKREFS